MANKANKAKMLAQEEKNALKSFPPVNFSWNIKRLPAYLELPI